MNNRKVPVAVIVLAFIFFWPLGVYLLYFNKTLGMDDRPKGGCLTSIFFSAAMFSIVAALANQSSSGEGWILMFAIFIVLGMSRREMAKRAFGKRKADRALLYHEQITAGLHSIEAIAVVAGVSPKTVTAELTSLIASGADRYTDVILTGDPAQAWLKSQYTAQKTAESEWRSSREPAARMFIAVCGSCGAKHILSAGEVKRCEFCDTPIGAIGDLS